MRAEGQKHHYIPIFYLRRWAASDGRLVEFSRRSPRNRVVPRWTYPGGSGYGHGLYTARDTAADRANIFENGFMRVSDDLAARAHQLMLGASPEVPADQLKYAWCRFMLSLVHRTPEAVRRSYAAMEKLYDEDDPELVERYEKSRRPSDPPTFAEFKARGRTGIVSRVTIDHLMKIIDSDEVLPRLFEMKWAICSPIRRYPLLTSDRPIVMTNGIGQPDGHIVMPVSPSRVLVCARTDGILSEIRRMSETVELARNLNERVVRQARRFVYGSNELQRRFVENHLGEKMWASPIEGDGQ